MYECTHVLIMFPPILYFIDREDRLYDEGHMVTKMLKLEDSKHSKCAALPPTDQTHGIQLRSIGAIFEF